MILPNTALRKWGCGLYCAESGNFRTDGRNYHAGMPYGSGPSNGDARSPVLRVFARNLDVLLDWAGGMRRFRDRAPLPEMLANYIADQRWGGTVSKRQLYRYLNSEQAASIDAVALIARAFDMEAWELLVPDFNVGVRHYVLTADEKQMFEDMKATARRFVTDETRQQTDQQPGTPSVDTDTAHPAPRKPDVSGQSSRTPARKRKAAKKTKAGH